MKTNKTKNVSCLFKCKPAGGFLYRLPRKSHLKQLWKQILNISTDDDSFLLCSNHFAKHNFFGIKNILKKNAVPDQNLSNVSTHNFDEKQNFTTEPMNKKRNIRNENERQLDVKKPKIKENHMSIERNCERLPSPDFFGFDLSFQKINRDIKWTNEETTEGSASYSNSTESHIDIVHTNSKEAEKIVQDTNLLNNFHRSNCKDSLHFNDSLEYFYQSLNTPAEMKCWTGIKKLETFNHIAYKFEEYYSQNVALPNDETPIKELLAIVLVRIRTNLAFSRMTTLFKMTEEEIVCKFNKCLPMLRSVLYTNRHWPSKRFGKSLCLILEPFEFSLEQNIETKISTVKALLGFNSIGTILWSSQIYSQLVTYHEICMNENIHDKLRAIDSVVVTRHIRVHDDFKKRGIFCHTNEKLIGKKISRIREIIRSQTFLFEIFQKPIDLKILSHLDDIFAIVSFINNIK